MNDVLGFLPRDAMHSAAYTMTRCPSDRHIRVFYIETSKDILRLFSPSGSSPFLFFCAKSYGEILRGPRMQARYRYEKWP